MKKVLTLSGLTPKPKTTEPTVVLEATVVHLTGKPVPLRLPVRPTVMMLKDITDVASYALFVREYQRGMRAKVLLGYEIKNGWRTLRILREVPPETEAARSRFGQQLQYLARRGHSVVQLPSGLYFVVQMVATKWLSLGRNQLDLLMGWTV